MKTQIIKKLSAFIIMMMFSFTYINAQPCNGNKIRVYKCSPNGVCNSKCVNPNNIPNGWNTSGCGAGCNVICNCNVRPVPFACGQICGWRVSSSDSEATFISFNTSIVPNPFSSTTTISFFLEESENVSIKIYDLNGRLIETLADNIFEEGEHSLVWNAEKENAGIYILRSETVKYSEIQKLSVVR